MKNSEENSLETNIIQQSTKQQGSGLASLKSNCLSEKVDYMAVLSPKEVYGDFCLVNV